MIEIFQLTYNCLLQLDPLENLRNAVYKIQSRMTVNCRLTDKLTEGKKYHKTKCRKCMVGLHENILKNFTVI